MFKKKEPVVQAPAVIPSKEEQIQQAESSLKLFFDKVLYEWDTQDIDFNCDYFKIAGISYRCDTSDIGMVRGVTFYDHSNPKDKTAIGIMGFDNMGRQKLLGYIPKEDKRRYKKLADGDDQLLFIGYIRRFTDEDGHSGIMGLIKVYAGDTRSNKMYQQMVKDTKLLIGAFRGYIDDWSLEAEGVKLEWELDRRF